MIETHCHLDYLKSLPLPELLQKAQESGVEKLITISVAPENMDTVRDLAHQHPNVFFTQGIHPHDAKEKKADTWDVIRERSQDRKMVAVGEIGLDYFYNHSTPEVQRQIFAEQLALATELNKPVVIHSRDADEDMLIMLREYAPTLQRKGVIHSFSSSLKLAEEALALGFYLGFNGIITFPKADNVRETVKLAPLSRILLETDSPFLTPVPHRGKENAPHWLGLVAQKIAELKNVSLDEVKNTTTQNAHQLFELLR
jgi:TatD DNase family protein